jgi:hypothetical protein
MLKEKCIPVRKLTQKDKYLAEIRKVMLGVQLACELYPYVANTQ